MSILDDTSTIDVADDGPRRPRERQGSLNVVREIIPAACYRRSGARAAVALAQGFALYLVPMVGLALTDRWYLVLPLWALFALLLGGRAAAQVALQRAATTRQARVWMAVRNEAEHMRQAR